MLLLSRIRVHGHSMQPTIMDGQIILVSSLPYIFKKPRVGDIVLIDQQKHNKSIKRIHKIANNQYFVLGDNQHDSLDSRTFGFIKRSAIHAKMLTVVS